MNDKPDRMPNVPPFVKFVASAVPMVFDNSLSYYEALCALWKYIQGMTDVINNNATLEEEYIIKFNELKTFVDEYFANLDVQEKINNKLDQMAEDGTLQEIISAYIQANVTWTFDTVADMKAATNLVDGSYAQTLGFYSVNDGGGALYKITNTGTANEMDVIAVGSLFANLIPNKEVKARQFGAYGDGIHDDTAALQQAIDYTSSVKGTLNITDGTYMVNALTSVFLKSDITVNFVSSKLKAIPTDQDTYDVLRLLDTKNCVINNAVIEGERDEHQGSTGEYGCCLNIRGEVRNIVFNDLTLGNSWGDGLFFYRTRVNNIDYIPEGVYFNGVTNINNCRRQGVTILAGLSIYFDTLNCKDINGTMPMAGIDIESEHSVDLIGDIHINFLHTIGTNKGFTLRSRSEIVGNISIGTILHEKQNTVSSGLAGRYEQAFRVMYEYFDSDQGKYSISVGKILADHNTIELENCYNGVTPSIYIGEMHSKDFAIINSATPVSYYRALLPIRYSTLTPLTTSMGNIFIGKYTVDNVRILDNPTTSNFVPVSVYCDGDASSYVFENVRIGSVEYLNIDSGVTTDTSRSGVVFNNAYFDAKNTKDVYERRDSGTFTHYTSGGNTVYFMPASDSTANKTIQLRVKDSLQPMKLNCVGKSTVVLNTAHQSTHFDKVYLNGVEVTAENNLYQLGTYNNGANFNITTANKNIYIQQTT